VSRREQLMIQFMINSHHTQHESRAWLLGLQWKGKLIWLSWYASNVLQLRDWLIPIHSESAHWGAVLKSSRVWKRKQRTMIQIFIPPRWSSILFLHSLTITCAALLPLGWCLTIYNWVWDHFNLFLLFAS
jgi:hypothetical protein